MVVPFTKYEAAILLNEYLKAEVSGIPRYAIAKKCSTMLRAMALNQGEKIDDSYRSIKGITTQIMRMESAYKGYVVMQPATQLFSEIVELYKNDREIFDSLVDTAKHIAQIDVEIEAVGTTQFLDSTAEYIAIHDNPTYLEIGKTDFFEWMHTEQHMAEATCRGYVSAIHRAEVYAAKHGLTSKKLYTSNLQEASAAAEALFQDAEFRQYNAKQHNSLSAAIKKWLTFLGSSRISMDLEFATGGKANNNMIPKNLVFSIRQYYGNGLRFDETVLHLLEEHSNTRIDKEIEDVLRNIMFCRSDGLYFLPEMAGNRDQLELLGKDSILEKIKNFGCIDICTLYSLFCSYGTATYLRNEDDLADYLSFTLSRYIRTSSALRAKIIRKIGISVNETLGQAADKVVCAIKKSGCATQDDLLLEFPVFSELFLHGLLEKYADEIIPTKINDCLCYQTGESMGFDPDFPALLNDTLEEMDRLSLPPSQDVVHAILSIKLGYNLMDEFNVPDNKTFRRIISAYYTGNHIRVWKSGCFVEESGSYV